MDSNNSSNSNSVAIVAIIVVGLLIAGAGYLYYAKDSTPNVIERTTVIEKDNSSQAKKDDPAFSFEYKDEDGTSTKIEAEEAE